MEWFFIVDLLPTFPERRGLFLAIVNLLMI